MDFKNIPQEGSGAVVISQLSGGHTEVGVSGVAAAASQVAAGNLKIVATFGSKRLLGKYANIPTLIESGVDVNWDSPNFIIGPPGIPKPIVDKFNKAIEETLQNSEVIKIASEMGASPVFKSPELLSKYLDNQKMVSIDILKMNALLK